MGHSVTFWGHFYRYKSLSTQMALTGGPRDSSGETRVQVSDCSYCSPSRPLCSGPPRAVLRVGHGRTGQGRRQAKVLYTHELLALTTALKAMPLSPLGLPELRSLVQDHIAREEQGLPLFFPFGFQLGWHVAATEAKNFRAGGADAEEVHLGVQCHWDRASHHLQRVKQSAAPKACPKLRTHSPGTNTSIACPASSSCSWVTLFTLCPKCVHHKSQGH